MSSYFDCAHGVPINLPCGACKEENMTDIAETLNERGKRYGDFTDHAEIAQALQDTMRRFPGWERLTPVMKQSMTVIADKQARILSGDPHYVDNWHDIQGYAKLAEERCIDDTHPQLGFEHAVAAAGGVLLGAQAQRDAAARVVPTGAEISNRSKGYEGYALSAQAQRPNAEERHR